METGPAAQPTDRRRLARRKLLLQRVADGGGCRRLGGRAVLRDLLSLLLLYRGLVAQTDAPGLRADLDDLEVVLLARLERTGALQRTAGGAVHAHVVAASAAAVEYFRVVAEPLDVVAQFDERAEHGDARDFALHDLPDLA